MSGTKKGSVPATIAGSIAGATEILVIWPMEMIKTNLQLGSHKKHYTGMFAGFRYHIKNDGFVSLYRGLSPVLIGSIPKAGIRFGAFDFFKRKFEGANGEISPFRSLAAGVCAGGIEAALVTTPVETLKTKLIGANLGFIEGTKAILSREGLRGVYQGVVATILKQSSNQGLRFMWFTEYKKIVTPEALEKYHVIRNANEISAGQSAVVSLVGGMTAGVFSVMGNNPFDVVKTRMQGLDGARYKSTFDCIKTLLRKEGPLVFYSGVIPRLGRVIPGQGVIFMSYDSIVKFVSGVMDT